MGLKCLEGALHNQWVVIPELWYIFICYIIFLFLLHHCLVLSRIHLCLFPPERLFYYLFIFILFCYIYIDLFKCCFEGYHLRARISWSQNNNLIFIRSFIIYLFNFSSAVAYLGLDTFTEAFYSVLFHFISSVVWKGSYLRVRISGLWNNNFVIYLLLFIYSWPGHFHGCDFFLFYLFFIFLFFLSIFWVWILVE